MIKKIKVSEHSDGFICVGFADGRLGEFDLKPFIESDFFTKLKQRQYFAQVALFYSGEGWREGQDLGPNTISAHLLQSDVHLN